MFGEYSFEYMELAWQVSIIKNISWYLTAPQVQQENLPDRRGTLPLLLPHLFESISNIESTDFFVVLELQELIAAMSSHIDKDIGSVVSKKALRAGNRRIHTACLQGQR